MNTTQVNEKQPENMSTAPVILGTNPEHSRGSEQWILDGVLPRVGLVVIRGRSRYKNLVAEDLALWVHGANTDGSEGQTWGGREIHDGKLLNLAAMDSFDIGAPDAIQKAQRAVRDFNCCVLVVDPEDSLTGNEALRKAAAVTLYVVPVSRVSGAGVISVTNSPNIGDTDTSFAYKTEIIDSGCGDRHEIISHVAEIVRNPDFRPELNS